MTEKEIQERLEREEAEENSEKEVSKSLTVNDILDKLEEEIIDDNDNKSVQITLFPPNCVFASLHLQCLYLYSE